MATTIKIVHVNRPPKVLSSNRKKYYTRHNMSQQGNNIEVANIDQESGEPTDEMIEVEGYECHMPVLEDVDHPLVPSFDHTYLPREMRGSTDVQLISYMIEDPDFGVMIEGEASTGKNACIEVLASNGNWPRVRVNFGTGTTYEQLVGRFAPVSDNGQVASAISRMEATERTARRIIETKDVDDKDKALNIADSYLPDDSSFTWKDGLLTRAVKFGWIFVADEINAAEAEATMPLHQVSEDRSSRSLTIEETSEVITPHPRFRFVATRNPIDYVGTGKMNDAFESRFYIPKFDYLPAKAEMAILEQRTNILENESEEAAESLVTLANDIRKQEQSGNEFVTKISTRDLLKVGKLTDLMDIRSATKTVFLGAAAKSDEDGIKEEINTQKFSGDTETVDDDSNVNDGTINWS